MVTPELLSFKKDQIPWSVEFIITENGFKLIVISLYLIELRAHMDYYICTVTIYLCQYRFLYYFYLLPALVSIYHNGP